MVGFCELDWRKVLSASRGQRLLVMAEILPAGSRQSGLPLVGSVEVYMELLPPLGKVFVHLRFFASKQAEPRMDVL
eukprot:scaffold647817_cov33-Prasinocladus_malaysianus.AAC.1